MRRPKTLQQRRQEVAVAAMEIAADRQRLDRIAKIIEDVDHRALAADGPVTPTLQEISEDEMRRIYALAKRQPESWRPK